MGDRVRKSSMGSASDDPPNSRLFIIGPRSLTEDDYRKHFNEYGTIEEIWLVKDRNTGESKGVTYIKYSKTSEAAKAMESLNGSSLVSGTRSIKIMIAASRDQGSKRDTNEEERTQRLFVVVPRNLTDTELFDYFKQFGEIDYASVIKDKTTKESKGFAYVKFYKFSHAARAFEECDKKYKPVFAEPRKPNASKTDDRHNVSFDFPTTQTLSRSSGFNSSPLPLLPPSSFSDEGYTKLKVVASPVLNQDQLWKLFDIVPGLDYCQVRYEGDRVRPPARAIAEVVYTSPQWAAHAKDKLHGFEYPPGFRLIVKPDLEPTSRASSASNKPKADIMAIAESIAHATQLIRAAGLSPDLLQSKLGLEGLSLPSKDSGLNCSVPLPDPKPLASVDAEAEARCFIVCSPSPLSNQVLKEVFCRFGDLIEVYLLMNKTCGYARFASKRAAEEAIKTLHGAEVHGIRLKVMIAEDRPDHQRKRQRTEDR